MVTELTFNDCGSFWTVLEAIVTDFQPSLVIITDCPAAGSEPSDHTDSSQLPLVDFVQLLTCPSARTKELVMKKMKKLAVYSQGMRG